MVGTTTVVNCGRARYITIWKRSTDTDLFKSDAPDTVIRTLKAWWMQAQGKGPNEAVCSSADSAEVVQCYAIYFVQFTYLDDDVAISAKMSAGIC